MKILKIPGELNALVAELRAIRKSKKAAEKAENDIVTKLKEFTDNEAATLVFNGQNVAMIEEKTANRIDSDKLRANYPEVAAACTTASSYLTVKCC
jgi:hypothetical protein